MCTDPMIFGVNSDNGNLHNILSKENWVGEYTCTDLTDPYTVVQFRHGFANPHQTQDKLGPAYVLGTRIRYFRGSQTYRFHYSMNGLTKVKIALVYSRVGIKSDIGMNFRSTYMNESYTLTGDGHIDFVVPYIDSRRYISTGESMGQVALIVLSSPYSTSGTANSSYAHFTVTKRFNNDLELYGPAPSQNRLESDTVAVNPQQTLSMQPLAHIKDLLLVGQYPYGMTCRSGYYNYHISSQRLNLENAFALRRSAYRYQIYTTSDQPLFISADVYPTSNEDHPAPFNSYIPYVPGNSQNGITVEVPRYYATNFDVSHSYLGEPRYNMLIHREEEMDGTYIYMSQSVSDEAMYTWFQVPMLHAVNANIQMSPMKVLLPPYEP